MVDGVYFQFGTSGIGRFWTSILRRLALREDLSIFLLDRGGAPVISGIQPIEFPSYTMTYTATDSLLIQQFCDKLDIDVFTSTHYTSPTMTPQVQIIHDLIPEMSGSDMPKRVWKERKLSLSYASHFGCISQSTRDDLRRFYPAIDKASAAVLCGGIETSVFNLEALQNLSGFREDHGVERPYFLLVGGRNQDENDKNTNLILQAIKIDEAADFDIVIVGGERPVDTSWLIGLPPGMSVKQLNLTESELATAYSGALALLCPLPYEGWLIPMVEAMACGCPVITTHQGALSGAPVAVSGQGPMELLKSLARIRKATIRQGFIDSGIDYVANISYDQSVQVFFDLLLLAKSLVGSEQRREFHRRWNDLRIAQANVDVGLD